MDDMRKLLDIVNETQVDEGWWDDYKDRRKTKKSNKARFKAGKKLGADRVGKIDKLVAIIQDLEVGDEVIEFIDANTKWYSRESVEQSEELLEKFLDDKGIKQVLVNIVRQQSGTDAPSDSEQQDKAVHRDKSKNEVAAAEKYLAKWKNDLASATDKKRGLEQGAEIEYQGEKYKWAGNLWTKQTPRGKEIPVSPKRGDPSNDELTTYAQTKQGLGSSIEDISKEMVNYLADRHGTNEWHHIKNEVMKVIAKYFKNEQAVEFNQAVNRGKHMEARLYRGFTDILREMNATWFDLGWKPMVLTEGQVVFEACIPHRDMLLEEFLTDVIAYDKIARLKKR